MHLNPEAYFYPASEPAGCQGTAPPIGRSQVTKRGTNLKPRLCCPAGYLAHQLRPRNPRRSRAGLGSAPRHRCAQNPRPALRRGTPLRRHTERLLHLGRRRFHMAPDRHDAPRVLPLDSAAMPCTPIPAWISGCFDPTTAAKHGSPINNGLPLKFWEDGDSYYPWFRDIYVAGDGTVIFGYQWPALYVD